MIDVDPAHHNDDVFRKQMEFFDLAERFRSANDSGEVELLGDRMGRMVFGG